MDASVSKVGSVARSNVSRHNPASKLQTYGFTLAIIVGIGGLAVGAIGVSGYFHACFHVGALSNMTQLDAIIMMAAGGGSGLILLIIGITGVVKNCKNIGHSKISSIPRTTPSAVFPSSAPTFASLSFSSVEKPSLTSHYPSIQAALPTIPIGLLNTIGDYASEVLYGPEAWGKWGVEVLDTVPPVPTVDLSKKDKVLLYIPQRIRVNGQEQNLTLKALKKISGGPFKYFNRLIKEQFGDVPALGGWVLIDINVIPESRGKDYATQQRMVEERGCIMPSALEVATLNLMVFSFTSKRLYGREPWTFTRCLEKINGQYSVVVGGFGSDGLYIDHDNSENDDCGAACVWAAKNKNF